MTDAANRGRDGMHTRWGAEFVIAEPEPFPNQTTWRTHVLRPIWWLVSRAIRRQGRNLIHDVDPSDPNTMGCACACKRCQSGDCHAR